MSEANAPMRPPTPETTKSQWADMVEDAWADSVWSVWAVADLVNFGLARFTDGSKDQMADLLGEVSEQLEVSPKTLSNYARVARRWPENLRRGPPLTLHHHEVVMKLSDDDALHWLTRAWEGGWSVARLRLEVNADSANEPLPLHNLVAVQRLFGKAGIRAHVGKRRVKFDLPGATVVLASDADITWGITD